MDIIVQGVGKRLYKPNEVEVTLNFYANDKSYETVLDKGVKSVEVFIQSVLNELNIDKERLKTRNFRISQNKQFDYQNQKEIDKGFDYNQSATLKLDYDTELMAKFMEKVALLELPPKYNLKFNIKEKEEAKKEVLAEAYKKAKEKAEIIAMAAGKSLKDCVKVDFKPFEERLISNSHMSDNDVAPLICANENVSAKARMGAAQVIQNIFTPEDVEISEALYCLWIAE